MTLPTLLVVDADTVPLVVEALTAGADTRTRAAAAASAQVEKDRRHGTDVRSRAVRVVTMLAEAQQLRALAGKLEAGDLAVEDALAARHLIATSGDAPRVGPIWSNPDLTDTEAADRIAAEVEASHTAEYDAAVDTLTPLADLDTPIVIAEPGLCLHEAWNTLPNGPVCADCGETLPADWQGPNLGGGTTNDD